jgi:hypothetical protein
MLELLITPMFAAAGYSLIFRGENGRQMNYPALIE